MLLSSNKWPGFLAITCHSLNVLSAVLSVSRDYEIQNDEKLTTRDDLVSLTIGLRKIK